MNLKLKQKFVPVAENLTNPEFSRTKKLEILRWKFRLMKVFIYALGMGKGRYITWRQYYKWTVKHKNFWLLATEKNIYVSSTVNSSSWSLKFKSFNNRVDSFQFLLHFVSIFNEQQLVKDRLYCYQQLKSIWPV